ncbi:MAG TPA: hypothetical protein VHD32_06805 [Candidatus Didemnitutus sp.]|nr:hypothetical protein [Candidatus Didemnitutus sp.]
MSSLDSLNHRWSERLRAPDAMPLLGLAPLIGVEKDAIGMAVRDFTRNRADALPRCLEVYPAATALWIAVTAAEVYQDGTLWSKMATGLGYPGAFSLHVHCETFTRAFRSACRTLEQPVWTELQSVRTHLVGSLLFHAGFPLCHSKRLADAMRGLERDAELPDPDQPDAARVLCEQLVSRLGRNTAPTLRRALKGPAGPYVADAALKVLFSGNYGAVNPKLGDALSVAFEQRTLSHSGPRLRAPFLRLRHDLGGIEAVCPGQDSRLTLAGGFSWSINGRPNAWPATEDFICSVPTKDLLSIRAVGLNASLSLTREWEIGELHEPYATMHVFDAGARRLRRSVEISDHLTVLPAGDYWAIMPTGWHIESANQILDWEHAKLAHITVTPARPVEAVGAPEESFVFASETLASILNEGESVLTDDGHRVHFGDFLKLQTWTPHRGTNWSVDVRCDSFHSRLNVGASTEISDGWYGSAFEVTSFVRSLSAGLHQIEITLEDNGTRKAQRTLWWWAGLVGTTNGEEFSWGSAPTNLERAHSAGFEFFDGGCRASAPTIAFRQLAFRLRGERQILRWRNAGIFVDLVRKAAGAQATIEPLPLASTVAGSPESQSWLRIWLDENRPVELCVDGVPYRQVARRGCIDLSLGDLALRFSCGTVQAIVNGRSRVLVGFHSPLQAVLLHKDSSDGYRSLEFVLREPLRKVRPVVFDLVSGRSETCKPLAFSSSGHALFDCAKVGLPRLEVCDHNRSLTPPPGGAVVSLDVPIAGWPNGMWLVTLEACRFALDSTEPIFGPDSRPVAVLVAVEPSPTSNGLHRALWSAWSLSLQDEHRWLNVATDTESVAAVVSCLDHVNRLWPKGVTSALQTEFKWLDVLGKAVANAAEATMRLGDQRSARLLLEMSRSHSGLLRLLRMPQIMALPASTYIGLSVRHPVMTGLAQCAEINGFDWLAEFVVDQPEFYSMDFVSRFGDFASTGIPTGKAVDELGRFDLPGFWRAMTAAKDDGNSFDSAARTELLGVQHWAWAMSRFRQRYAERNASDKLGHANTCATQAPHLRDYVRTYAARANLIPRSAWTSTWPELNAPTNFEESLPQFCSAFALTARIAGAKRLAFTGAWESLSSAAHGSETAAAGVRALLELAPELFGFFLLLWESLIKSGPHHE